MHEFKYKNNELYCEETKVAEIAKKFGTPLYLYSRKTLIDHYQKIKRAFSSLHPLICFSVKANSNLTLLKILAGQGAGMDVVSGGELYRVLKVRVNPQRIVYAGVGKNQTEIAAAIKAGIFLFNVESLAELTLIEQVAGQLRKTVNVSLRINPDIAAHTHRFITTGTLANKFGLDLRTAEDLFLRAKNFVHLRLIGLHMHIGSQITERRPFVLAIKKILPLIKRLQAKRIPLKYFNIGGGLGIVYHHEQPQSAGDFARAVLPLLKTTGLQIILEPGRFIAGNSGILLTKVIYIKKTPKKTFAIVDAGMNDLIRPSLYNAYHEIIPVYRNQKPVLRLRPSIGSGLRSGLALSEVEVPETSPSTTSFGKLRTGTERSRSARNQRYDIVGPICESADFLAKNRRMTVLQSGDLLAVMGAGAYGFSMSSNYNSRPRAAEVLVDKVRYRLIRERETNQDLIRQEIIPKN